MIWVRLRSGETLEDVARRVSGILALDTLSEAPPYWQVDSQKWQLDRGNNWFASADLASPGWVSVRARYRPSAELSAVVAVLREIDKREVRTISPRDSAQGVA